MENLQRYLATSGVRQAALAGLLGITRGYMSQVVSGSRQPSLTLALKIAQVTDGAVPVSAWMPPEPTPAETSTPLSHVEDAA